MLRGGRCVRGGRWVGAGARRAGDRRSAGGRGRGRARDHRGVTVGLAGLAVFGHHGYLEEERRLGQRFLVDLRVDVEEAASASDLIDETVDYRRLAELVGEVFAGPPRLLLESLAGAI